MPWWGWLIAGCVAAVLLTYLTVWVIVLRAVRAAMSDDERAAEAMRRRWAARRLSPGELQPPRPDR